MAQGRPTKSRAPLLAPAASNATEAQGPPGRTTGLFSLVPLPRPWTDCDRLIVRERRVQSAPHVADHWRWLQAKRRTALSDGVVHNLARQFTGAAPKLSQFKSHRGSLT